MTFDPQNEAFRDTLNFWFFYGYGTFSRKMVNGRGREQIFSRAAANKLSLHYL
jgi:hypothetical protein